MRVLSLKRRPIVAVATVAAAGMVLSACNPGSFAVGGSKPGGVWVNYKSAPDTAGQNVVQIGARVVGADRGQTVRFKIGLLWPQAGPTPSCSDGKKFGQPEGCTEFGDFLGSDEHIAQTAAEKDEFWPLIQVSGDRRLNVTVACDPSPCAPTAKVELRARDLNGAFIGDFQPVPAPK